MAAGQDHKDTDFINGEVRFSSPDDRPVTDMVGASIYRQDTTFVGSGGLDDYNPAPTQRRLGATGAAGTRRSDAKTCFRP